MLKKLAILLIATSLWGCKKDDDQQTIPPTPSYPAGGFIKGTVTGTRSDGEPFSYNFDYKFYNDYDFLSFDDFNSTYSVSVSRLETGSVYNLAQSSATIQFECDNPNPPNNISNIEMELQLVKSLGNNSFFVFYNNTSDNISISNYAYNPATRVMSGEFSYQSQGTNNSSGNLATITGSFQTTSFLDVVTRVRGSH